MPRHVLNYSRQMPTYSYVWQFQVSADCVADFESHYAPGGSWTDLFQLSRGYVGTVLLKNRANPLRYVTIDTWESLEAYQQFRITFEAQYQHLDACCAGFTTSEVSLGEFNGVAPDPSSMDSSLQTRD
jgi:heme-degrading monooxygenase HmoA